MDDLASGVHQRLPVPLRFWYPEVLPFCLGLVEEWKGRIYDCNAHIGKYPYVDLGSINPWCLDKGFGFIEDYAACLDLRGVIISSFESLCYDHHKGNKRLVDLLGRTRLPIKGYLSVHPLQRDCLDILESFKGCPEIIGVKFHPLIQQINPASAVMLQLCEQIGQLGWMVVIHTGSHHPSTSPAHMASLVGSCPHTRFILAHMGGTRTYTAVELAENHENVLLESSLASPAMQRLEEAVSRVGAERILFGTDYPCSNPFMEIIKILTANISVKQKELILFRNAELLFQA